MDLDDIAAAIADGTPIRWTDTDALHALTPDLARRARLVERIAQLHASLPPASTFASSRRAALLDVDAPKHPDDGTLLTWGPLTIVERLGSGSFGDVYRALDPRLNRPVALKLLKRRDRRESTVVGEGHLMARVRHPNVVTIYGAERIDGRVGLWMEFVDGPTLDQEVKTHGPFPPEAITRVGVELCRALAAVHRAGLVHRDLKAQNVMRDPDGRVVLTDFGAGRDLVDIAAAPGGELAGTPLYLAPEVLSGERASPASDLYSLGVLLFYLATVTFPVHGRSLQDIRDAHAAGRRASLADLRPGLPSAFRACIARAIDPDPARRFASAPEMETALQNAAIAGQATTGGRTGVWLIAGSVATAAVAAASWLSVSGSPPDASPPGQSAAATAAPGTRVMRQVSSDSTLAGPGGPSPDGTLLSYVDWNTCNLAVAETGTDNRWAVTANPTPGDPQRGCAGTSRFAAQGAELFYVWSMEADGRRVTEIRRIPVRGGVARTVWRAPDDADVELKHWAGGDQALLVGLNGGEGSQLLVIAPADGTVRAARATGPFIPDVASLSPDGSLIAFDRATTADPSDRVVVVASLDDGAEDVIAQSPAIDHAPLWTSDGRYVLFHSDRSGPSALWAQRIEGGRAVDPPIRLEPNLGWAHPMGLTATGGYFVRREMGTRDVYRIGLDPVSGAVAGEPVRVSATAGANGTSEWSPDGRSIAFFRGSERGRMLVIASVAGGRERVIANPSLEGVARPRWEPGGRTMLLKATFRDVWGLHRLDLHTEAITTLMRFPPNGNFQEYELLPGTRAVLYASRQRRAFVRRDLQTGQESVVHRVAPTVSMLCLAVSRDGGRFAYGAYERDGRWSMRVVDLREPATAKEILAGDASERVCPSVWTADGQDVLFTRSPVKAAPDDATQLWAVNAAGGQIRPVGLTVDGLNEVRLSPDGRQLSYDGGWPSQEVWVLDNVLSSLPP
ncbi:MAG: protein kinase [Vicinamibacterales bacterium]